MTSLLELRDATRHFDGLPAVDGVDLVVAPGTIVAVIGPNGAGKSTLLRLVAGLHVPTHGRVLLDGDDIGGRPVHTIRRLGVATVLQTPRPLMSMTVREQVVLGAMYGSGRRRRGESASRRAADATLDLVGLSDAASWSVDRLTTVERRRLGLARALVGRPRLLLLDEVMAGLGVDELEEAIGVVRTVRDHTGVTVVWVEHVMGAVRALAERVVVLDQGRIVASGPPAEVIGGST